MSARARRRRKVCARCGYPPRLAGPLMLATLGCEAPRWLCRDSEACAGRRRAAERAS